MASSIEGAGQMDIHMENNEGGPLSPYTKIYSKQINDYNHKVFRRKPKSEPSLL